MISSWVFWATPQNCAWETVESLCPCPLQKVAVCFGSIEWVMISSWVFWATPQNCACETMVKLAAYLFLKLPSLRDCTAHQYSCQQFRQPSLGTSAEAVSSSSCWHRKKQNKRMPTFPFVSGSWFAGCCCFVPCAFWEATVGAQLPYSLRHRRYLEVSYADSSRAYCGVPLDSSFFWCGQSRFSFSRRRPS